MMMMMTMMTYTIPYRRTKTHIWDKVLMGIWVHPIIIIIFFIITIIFIIFILIFNFTFVIFFFLGRAESRDTLQETGSPSVTRSCSPSTMSLSWKLAWGRRRGSTAWTMGKGCSSALAGPSAEQKPASARKRIEPAIQDATRTSAVTTISSECVSSVITPSSECVSSQ